MQARSLPLTRRGVRSFHWGLQVLAGVLIAGFLLSFVAGALPGGFAVVRAMGNVLPWLRTAASLLMLLGILLATAAPAEARVAPWGIAILLLSALSYGWPVVVYAADLPFVALAGPFGDLGVAATLLQGVLFAGLLATLCRWVATIERRDVEGAAAAPGGAPGATEAADVVAWESLAGRSRRLFHAGSLFLAIGFVLAFLASRLNPFESLRPLGNPAAALLAGAGMVVWGLVLLVRFARTVWAVDRAFAQSARREEGGDPAWSGMPADRLAAGSLAAGILALGGFVANQWAATTLAGDWTARHIREIVGDGPSGGAGGTSVGRAAPAMGMRTIDGETIQLADRSGGIVVLNFWATWCPPCVAEIPDLVRLAKEIEAEGGIVIGISDEDPATIRSFVAARDMPYRIVSGSGWPAPFDAIRAIPATYVIDAAGTIRAEFVGARSYEEFRRAYEAAKEPAAVRRPPDPVAEGEGDAADAPVPASG